MTQTTNAKLENKIAVVTGGSRGIGAAITKRLAKDGATVVFTYANSPKKAEEVVREIESFGGKSFAVKADSSVVAEIQKAISDAAKKFGKIDILVNNAGLGLMGPIDQFSLDDFDKLIAVNIRGVFVAAQEALKYMGQGGRVINIGSCLGDYIGMPGVTAYAMTKSAVAGLTRGIARDVGDRGITVNNIQPGPIDTDLNPANSEFADSLKSTVALKRYGNVDEIANLTAFLASSESSYITGASYTADGGVNA